MLKFFYFEDCTQKKSRLSKWKIKDRDNGAQ